MRILVINPGSTSTKVAYYVDGQIAKEKNIAHSEEELHPFHSAVEQMDFRREIILDFMQTEAIQPKDLDAVVGRGGILPPVRSGAYEVNEEMLDYLQHQTPVDHPSNLGALLAYEIKNKGNSKTLALVYDPVSVDEYADIARISGLKEIERKSLGHALNMRAAAMKAAQDEALDYQKSTFIVAHLGGGNSVSIQHNGQMIDSISDDEGPFSTERTGGLPVKEVIALCYQKTQPEMLRLYKREGGLISYSGTNDAQEIEKRIAQGDQDLKLVYDAYIYQIAKGIGSLATVTNGTVDRIVLTGGVSHSQYVVKEVSKRVSFLASVCVLAGEHEMIALARGAERVLLGQEKSQLFTIKK